MQMKSPPLETMSLNSFGSEPMQIDQICLLTISWIAEKFLREVESLRPERSPSMPSVLLLCCWFSCFNKQTNSTWDKLGWLLQGILLEMCTFGNWDHTPDGKNCSPLFILTCHLDSSLVCPARDSGQSPPPRHSWFYWNLSWMSSINPLQAEEIGKVQRTSSINACIMASHPILWITFVIILWMFSISTCLFQAERGRAARRCGHSTDLYGWQGEYFCFLTRFHFQKWAEIFDPCSCIAAHDHSSMAVVST